MSPISQPLSSDRTMKKKDPMNQQSAVAGPPSQVVRSRRTGAVVSVDPTTLARLHRGIPSRSSPSPSGTGSSTSQPPPVRMSVVNTRKVSLVELIKRDEAGCSDSDTSGAGRGGRRPRGMGRGRGRGGKMMGGRGGAKKSSSLFELNEDDFEENPRDTKKKKPTQTKKGKGGGMKKGAKPKMNVPKGTGGMKGGAVSI